jgi:oligopeptide transport system substrate-binding protein
MNVTGRFGALFVLVIAILMPACASPPSASLVTTALANSRVAGTELRGIASQTQGQEVRLPSIEPPTLDPGLAEDVASIDIISQLFDGLVAFDEAGAATPVGAETWNVSPDGLTYTFILRQGPTWSDGVPLRAQDYEWAWKRNISPATASPYANSLFPLKNAEAIHEGTLDPEQLGVQALDDKTLVATLEQPASYFLRLASTWTLMPLRRDVIEAYGDAWTEPAHIVTNGPFLLKEWRHDTRIVLERNEAYWGTKPTIQRATFRAFPEDGSEQMLAAYEAGEIDTTGTGVPSELPTSQIDRILGDPTLRSEARSIPQSGTALIVVNNRRPYLKDPRVRQALGMSLDRRQILDQVLRRAGTPAFTPVPEGIAGRRPDLWPTEDVAAARSLLAAAGYPDGRGFPEITLTYNTNAEWRIFAEYAQQHWKDTLGITVRLEAMEFATFLKWRRTADWTERGDLYRGAWFSDYEDPNNWYNVLWHSAADPNAFNGGWRNEHYDTLVGQATGELNSARRVELYGQAEAIMAQDYPHIPLFHYEVRTLVKPYVQGYNPARVLGLTPLRSMSIVGSR